MPLWPHSVIEAVPVAKKDGFTFSSKRLLNVLQSEMALEEVVGDKKRGSPADGRTKSLLMVNK
jgi:hypothetical protein